MKLFAALILSGVVFKGVGQTQIKPIETLITDSVYSEKVSNPKLLSVEVKTGKIDTIEYSGISASQFGTASYNPFTDKIISLKPDSNSNTLDWFNPRHPADSLPMFPNYPISTTVILNVSFVNKNNGDTIWGNCSGVMVSKNLVLTAAHCLVQAEKKSPLVINTANANPGYNSGVSYFGYGVMKKWYVFDEWIDKRNFTYDIALIELNYDVGYMSGWMGIGRETEDFYKHRGKLFTFGYPAYNVDGDVRLEGDRIYYQSFNFDSYDVNTACADGEVFFGQSGSGIFSEKSPFQNGYLVQGVISSMYTYGLGGPIRTCFCMVDTPFMNIFKGVLAVNEVKDELQMKIYPNPVKDFLYFTVEGVSDNLGLKIEFIDVTGKLIYSQLTSKENFDNANAINVAHLAQGIYIVRVTTNETIVQTRIYKQ
jgi:V8-like Glu-specific endopeptidase